MSAARYRKKPVVIEAVQWDGKNWDEVAPFVGDARFFDIDHGNAVLFIDTLEGQMRANPGDWIIRGVQGEFYPCKPDIFAASYEAMSP